MFTFQSSDDDKVELHIDSWILDHIKHRSRKLKSHYGVFTPSLLSDIGFSKEAKDSPISFILIQNIVFYLIPFQIF